MGGSRVVIDKSKAGKNAICNPVNAADLQLVNAKPKKIVDNLWGNAPTEKTSD